MGLKHKVNRLMLDLIRVNKVMELFFLITLSIVLWVQMGFFLKEFTTFYNQFREFWALYVVILIIPTILHINYHNVFYNLRLSLMAHNYNTGLF
jgi:hypothetical protein